METRYSKQQWQKGKEMSINIPDGAGIRLMNEMFGSPPVAVVLWQQAHIDSSATLIFDAFSCILKLLHFINGWEKLSKLFDAILKHEAITVRVRQKQMPLIILHFFPNQPSSTVPIIRPSPTRNLASENKQICYLFQFNLCLSMAPFILSSLSCHFGENSFRNSFSNSFSFW
jgi:hypothetical protein